MDKNNDYTPVKSRSARACIATGYRLYADNFRRIVRDTWMVAVGYALVYGLCSRLVLAEYPRLLMALQTGNPAAVQPTASLAISLAQLLQFVVSLMLVAAGFSLLRHHRNEGDIPRAEKWLTVPKGAWLRTLLSVVVGMAIALVASLVTGLFLGLLIVLGKAAIGRITLMLTAALIFLVIALLLMPLVHPFTKYITDNVASLFAILKTEYGRAMRHWGLCFSVVLVTILITMVAGLLTTLPATVLTVANFQSAKGMLMGDPAGMPDYMGWMSALVFCIAAFIQAYIMLSTLFPLYYLSGSIDADEQERMGENKNIKK